MSEQKVKMDVQSRLNDIEQHIAAGFPDRGAYERITKRVESRCALASEEVAPANAGGCVNVSGSDLEVAESNGDLGIYEDGAPILWMDQPNALALARGLYKLCGRDVEADLAAVLDVLDNAGGLTAPWTYAKNHGIDLAAIRKRAGRE